jgi:hypothetical protein
MLNGVIEYEPRERVELLVSGLYPCGNKSPSGMAHPVSSISREGNSIKGSKTHP